MMRLSEQELARHLSRLEEIGVKWAGSPGERQTRDYIQDEFEKIGLKTRVEAFDYLSCPVQTATVQITSPVAEELHCEPVAFLEERDIEAEAVYVGTGSRQEFETLRGLGTVLSGKIAVAVSDAPFMLTPLALEYGAVGLLTISDTMEPELTRHCCGAFYGTTAVPSLPADPREFPVPLAGAMIPMHPGGHKVLSLLSAGTVRIRIANRAQYRVAKSWNVIGEIPGQECPAETVIIGAHYDTEYEVPGIWDNGTGVAGLIETARALRSSGRSFRRTLVFAAFGCEEVGLWGSVDYVGRNRDDFQKNCVAFLNLDCTSGGSGVSNTVWLSGDMRESVWEAAGELDWPIDVAEGVEATFSDYAPFRDLGIPVAWIWKYPPIHPYYHTEKDVLRTATQIPELARVTEVTARCAANLASSEQRPG